MTPRPVLIVPLLLLVLTVAAPARPVVTVGLVAGVEPLPVVPRGAFGWPVGPAAGSTAASPPARAGQDGAVTRRFRAPPTPYGRGHRGVDLAVVPGEVVRAAGAGTVAFVGLVGGRGVVSVDHTGGLRTTYEPVTSTLVPGTPVARGSPLGTVDAGHPGCPVAACLHWGLRTDAGLRTDGGLRPGGAGGTEYLDPLLLLGLGHVRLRPVTGDP